MISSSHHGKKKGLHRYNFELFEKVFGFASHTARTKIEASLNNMLLEGPGTGLVNPCTRSLKAFLRCLSVEIAI